MIRCLRTRFPEARIDMVVRDDFHALIAHNPHLDLKIGFARSSGAWGLFRLWNQLKKNDYDLVYDAHFTLRSRLLTLFLRPRVSVHLQKHYLRRALSLTLKLPLMRHFDRLLNRYIEPLKEFGVTFDGKGPELFGPGQELLYRRQSRTVPLPVLGLIPSAAWPGKRWNQFGPLAKLVVEKTDWKIVLFAGPNDGFCAHLLDGLDPARVKNLQGRLSLPDTMLGLLDCDFVVANDTGLMHMADALGVPPVVVLGPTSRELGCLPFHPLSRVVEKSLWCRPCSKNGQAPCIRGRRYCLEIEPNTVFEAARAVVEQLRSA